MNDREKPLEELARGFRARTLVTAKLATKVGFALAKKQLAWGERGAKASGGASGHDAGDAGAHADAEEDAAATARAETLVAELGRLKGVMVKFGQMASYLPGSMSPTVQRVLAQLQSRTTAMAYGPIAAVVAGELGEAPDALFTDFAREPFAAASIGQVHRARFEGRAVAVKVQYPGVDTLLESDLDTVKTLARIGTLGTSMDAVPLVDELRTRMREECDYRFEAKNTELFRRLLAGDTDASVPEVVAARSGRRVITTSFVDAADFQTFRDRAPTAAKHRAATTIFRTCFDSIFRHCIYNADPHPGNYLFGDDGHVTFLDFGCVRRFDPAMIDRWKIVARSVVAGDRARFQEHFPSLGMVGKPKKFDYDAQWTVMRYLYRPFLERGFRYDERYVRASYDLLIFKNPNKNATAMPPEWLFLNRLQWGLNAILAQLHAEGPFPEIWRAAIESETTPLDASP